MVYGLGNKFDLALGVVPTDLVAGAITGKRVHLKNYAQVTVVLIATSGSTDIADIDIQQHTAATGGTSTDLDVTTFYYLKEATTLDNSVAWTKVTQAIASETTDVGSASKQQLAVWEIDASQLSDGYEWFSVDLPDAGSNGTKYVTVLYILHGLAYGRAPELLPASLT
jgi:hypothetical protein